MQYFNTLPKIISTDSNGASTLLTNLMARSSVIPQLLNNAALYYQYDIQDGETPETIAYKYYGESYRYWIVLFANQILDPQWQWPMSSQVFAAYMDDKYENIDVYGTIHSYQKIITTLDLTTSVSTVNTVNIDQNVYNSLQPSINTFTLPTGTVTVTISKNAINIYDYEIGLNEANRTINLLNSSYVDEIEDEFKTLMSV